MSGIKRTLDETWYEQQGRIELHWMEKEYFNYIASPKSEEHETKPNNEEESACLESEGQNNATSHQANEGDKRHTRTGGEGIEKTSQETSEDF